MLEIYCFLNHFLLDRWITSQRLTTLLVLSELGPATRTLKPVSSHSLSVPTRLRYFLHDGRRRVVRRRRRHDAVETGKVDLSGGGGPASSACGGCRPPPVSSCRLRCLGGGAAAGGEQAVEAIQAERQATDGSAPPSGSTTRRRHPHAPADHPPPHIFHGLDGLKIPLGSEDIK